MKRLYICLIMATVFGTAKAQQTGTKYNGVFYNEEYQVYIHLNVTEKNIEVPDHEIFGPLPGYLEKKGNPFFWMITDAETGNKGKYVKLDLINDYGSEDLVANLRQKNDSLFLLEQKEGSILKVASKGKWVKIPKTLELKKVK